MNFFLNKILTLPKEIKKAILISFDVLIFSLSVFISFLLFFGPDLIFYKFSITYVIFSNFLFTTLSSVFGLYNSIIRFSGINDIEKIFKVFLIFFICSFVVFIFHNTELQVIFLFFQTLISLFFIIIFRRLSYKVLNWLVSSKKIKHSEKKQIFIYGAGQAGMQLCRFFDNNQEVKVAGFLDDNLDLQSRTLNNIKIYKPEKLNRLLKNKKIDQIILAMPSVKKERKKEILNFLLNFNIPVRTLPNLEKITTKSVHSNDIVSFDIEDLLGREPIYPNKNLLLKNITNKVVLVTGAGGSIGSELSRQIIKLRPKRLLLIDNSEFALFSIYNEIKNIKDNTKMKDIDVLPLLCNVNVYKDLQIIFKKHQPFSIFHAAAYKHVDLVEKNISYAIKNNIFSTLNLIRLSIQLRVKNFIFISTDKAVRPTNIMGATKRVCELILQAFAKKYLKTKISIIRFGNVLGSSGSVVPIFKNQINNGGPVTVSHKNVKRFFMTITEAVELVIQSSSIDQQSGKIFYLDMGEPIKIFDLAKRMINLHGFEAVLSSKKNKNEIQIIFTGLKNGEKMYEELTVDGSPDKTVHPRIFSVEDTFLEWKQLSKILNDLEKNVNSDNLIKIIKIFKRLNIGFNQKINN